MKFNRNSRLAAVGVVLIIVVGLALGCSATSPQTNSQAVGQTIVEQYQRKFNAKVPYPLELMNDSIELRNLREKLLRFNKPDKIGYVYIMSDTGEVTNYYTIKGKVSSTASQMTPTEQTQYICVPKPFLAPDKDPKRDENQICTWSTTPSPGDDGSYGDNEPGIFFLTTEDVYESFAAGTKWHYSDAPEKVNSVTHRLEGLIDGAKPSSVGETVEQRSK
jgi:hypothetical protein